MPLSSAHVGSAPVQSPLRTHALLPWTMNFSAACGELRPCFVDNSGGQVPQVHPLFLAGCAEIVGAWACVYHAGMTKAEVIKHTFAHHSFDGIFHRRLESGAEVETVVSLAGVGRHRSGGHFVTSFRHSDRSGLMGESWWGGVLLGAPADVDFYSSSPPPRLKPSTSSAALVPAGTERTLELPASQAHIWDSCIRDPRRPKAKSSDINPHTNVDFARKAGLQARTLNGLCVLALALEAVLDMAGCSAPWPLVRRVACEFGSPVFIDFAPVKLIVRILDSGVSTSNGVEVLCFEVLTVDGKRGVRNGYIELSRETAPKL